jgi:uncharacterized membrane protein YgcG
VARRRHTGLVLGGTLLAGVLALGPTGAGGASNGQVCEGVVIDDGNGSASAQAADVTPGTSDLQALAAAGDSATQNDSGLICAIDDYPADGLQNCLATSGSDYFYWSYWEGDPSTDTWTYAEVGPASHTVSSGQTYVQGWRYEDPGPDTPSATKPSITPAAAFAQACPGVTPVASGGSGGSGSGGSGSGSDGSGGGGSSAGGANPSAASTTTSPPAATGEAPPPTRPTVVGGATASTAATTTTRPGTSPDAPSGAAGSTTTTAPGDRSGPKPVVARAALAGTRHGSSGGGDPALPVVIVAVLIVALGGLAWWRWRRRPVEE